MKIPFNRPPFIGVEEKNISEVIKQHAICGDGVYTKKCNRWLEKNLNVQKAMLTTSCTHALEMTALLSNIKSGDEVIMPSFTFVSTALAFVLRGARIVFVDIRPDTMNIDERLIESAITSKTRAIVLVHYAGVACEMDTIIEVAKQHKLLVIEDAAQAITSEYHGRCLGTIGDFGCLSFHETKNISMGEGGAILIKSKKYIARAEIIREKGTNRSQFFRGEINKYTWYDVGSSYLPSELNAAYLYGQLENAALILNDRMASWNIYYDNLKELKEKGYIDIPVIPKQVKHNAHIFFIKARDLDERTALIKYLEQCGVNAVFHYIPLHSSPAGKEYGRFCGEDRYTTKESERLLRLPLYYGIGDNIYRVIEAVERFYRSK